MPAPLEQQRVSPSAKLRTLLLAENGVDPLLRAVLAGLKDEYVRPEVRFRFHGLRTEQRKTEAENGRGGDQGSARIVAGRRVGPHGYLPARTVSAFGLAVRTVPSENVTFSGLAPPL